tara:strand:+ start:1568 stop:2140 length:573 start_codon:yes stop_codon:yes gene_type:complete
MSKKFIAFTGPGSSGKTSLIDSINFSNLLGHECIMINSHTRDLKRQGFPINSSGSDETQIMISIKHFQNVLNDLGQSCVFDRCVLDGYIYTKWLWQKKKVSNYVVRFAEGIFNNYISKYNVIFHCVPDFDFVKDSDRSTNKEDRNIINHLYETEVLILKNLYHNSDTQIVSLTGSPAKRKEVVENVCKNL